MDWGSMPRSETGFEGNSMASLDLKAKPAVFLGEKRLKGRETHSIEGRDGVKLRLMEEILRQLIW